MFVLAKICLFSYTITTIVSTSYSNVIPAAIIRRHTVTYKDVPVDSYKPIHHPVIYVPSTMANLFVHFRSKSSQVHLRQEHKGTVGQTHHSTSSDEPHYLKHEVQKPVIQTIREVIVPYRQVIQHIKPVVEEVKTVVATGVPKSMVYMNFGPKYSNGETNTYDNYQYVMNTNHESATPYNSGDSPVSQHNPDQSSSVSSDDNQKSLYDLSSIYGIKTSADHLANYLMPSKSDQQSNSYQTDVQNNQGSPLVYGLTTDLQTDSGNSGLYGYKVGYVPSPENNVQNSDYGTVINSYEKTNTLEPRPLPVYRDNNDYGQTYNYVDNIEPQYYVNEIETKGTTNSNNYYSDINTSYGESQSQPNSNPGYTTQNVNPGYSDEYSGDLATSDGSALGNPSPIVPIFGPFASVPITKSTTLGSLAELMSSLPWKDQYTYDSPIPLKEPNN